MALTLCVLLWPRPGSEDALIRYEDRVLECLDDHGARLLQRVRSRQRDEGPYEVQILEFPSSDALDSYLGDPRRTSLLGERDAAIARTEMLDVEVIHAS